jgi:hypothetical protein
LKRRSARGFDWNRFAQRPGFWEKAGCSAKGMALEPRSARVLRGNSLFDVCWGDLDRAVVTDEGESRNLAVETGQIQKFGDVSQLDWQGSIFCDGSPRVWLCRRRCCKNMNIVFVVFATAVWQLGSRDNGGPPTVDGTLGKAHLHTTKFLEFADPCVLSQPEAPLRTRKDTSVSRRPVASGRSA